MGHIGKLVRGDPQLLCQNLTVSLGLGVGLLVGGVIFSATGSKLSDKADEAWEQMEKAEKTINKICEYLLDLRKMAGRYINSLENVLTVKHLKVVCWQKRMANLLLSSL